MSKTRVPTAVKKRQGTFNVTRDKDTEFVLLDGIILATPEPPEDFTQSQTSEWNIVWKHLIAHEYGKAADVKIVELYVRSMTLAFKYLRAGEMADHQKSFNTMMKCSEALGLNPAAMAKVAILQKKGAPGAGKLKALIG